MKKTAATIGLALILVVITTGAMALAQGVPPGSEPGEPAAQLSSSSNFTYEQAQSFSSWSLYDTGPSFEGIPLTDLLRRNDPATYDAASLEEGPGANYVSFLYGTCVPAEEVGCPVPLEIQMWPACSRKLDWQPVEGVDVAVAPDETLTIRGVVAAFYDDWARLEFTAGDAIVVLFGDDRTQLLDAANELRGVNNGLTKFDPFPTPLMCE